MVAQKCKLFFYSFDITKMCEKNQWYVNIVIVLNILWFSLEETGNFSMFIAMYQMTL